MYESSKLLPVAECKEDGIKVRETFGKTVCVRQFAKEIAELTLLHSRKERNRNQHLLFQENTCISFDIPLSFSCDTMRPPDPWVDKLCVLLNVPSVFGIKH